MDESALEVQTQDITGTVATSCASGSAPIDRRSVDDPDIEAGVGQDVIIRVMRAKRPSPVDRKVKWNGFYSFAVVAMCVLLIVIIAAILLLFLVPNEDTKN